MKPIYCSKTASATTVALSVLLLVSTFAFLSNTSTSNAQASTSGTSLTGCWSVYPDSTLGMPTGNLTGLAVVGPGEAWAVGSDSLSPDRSQALIKHWDGSRWNSVDTPNSRWVSSYLTTVVAVSKDSVWAFGGFRNETESGVLVMRWNGREWLQMPTPKLGEIKAVISASAAVSNSDIWAVGTDFTNISDQGGEKALVIHWNGQTWSTADLPPLTGNLSALRGVVAISANDVWAVGTNIGASNKFQPLLLHWDGTKWSTAPLPPTVEAGQLYAVGSMQANDLWAVGVGTTADGFQPKTLTMHYDGQAWSVVPSPNSNDQYASNTLRVVTTASATDVWAIGEALSEQPLFLHWDGNGWTNYDVPPTPRLLKITAAASLASGDIWMLGEYYRGSISGQTPAAPIILRYTSMPCTSSIPSPTMSSSQVAVPGSGSRLFPETNKTVSGIFLNYWNSHGGLAQQGYPISGEMKETSEVDGKIYTVQYFERAVFELHMENAAPNDVLLSLLGSLAYKQKYPNGAAELPPTMGASASMTFPQTGKTLSGAFLQYWKSHGGLAQQGYPISNLIRERSEIDGKEYVMQYFERAVFEMHPENKAPYDVLLSQLGTMKYKSRYSSGSGNPGSALAAGMWGGQHVTMQVTANGAQLEFDCASATITGPITVSNGRIDVMGTYSQERGGPVRVDDPSTAQPARFTGTITGDALTLNISLLNNPATPVGPFTLFLGQQGKLLKCM